MFFIRSYLISWNIILHFSASALFVSCIICIKFLFSWDILRPVGWSQQIITHCIKSFASLNKKAKLESKYTLQVFIGLMQIWGFKYVVWVTG